MRVEVGVVISFHSLLHLDAGKGTNIWHKTGSIYDGDWEQGKRVGFGTLSVKDSLGILKKKYSGGWKNNKRHVSIDHPIKYILVYTCI